MVASNGNSDRDALILILAPIGRDAHILQEVLKNSGVRAHPCGSVQTLCEEIGHGAGAAIVADEALPVSGVESLARVLRVQESWSDLPFIILTQRGAPTLQSLRRFEQLEPLGALTLLERPLRPDTIASAARTALRARAKQYDVRRRDAELRLVTDNVPVLIAYIDRDQVYRRVNHTYVEWFGKPPEEIVGQTIRAVAGERHATIAQPQIARALSGHIANFESQILDVDGNFREVTVSYSPDHAPGGGVRGIVALVQDMTERKRQEGRQALLLKLLDGQRVATDPSAMMQAAAGALGRYLQVDRVGFFETSGDQMLFQAGWTAGRLPLLTGKLPAQFIGAGYLELVRAGKTLGLPDVRIDPRTADSRFHEIGTVAIIGAPIIRNGLWQAGLYVNHAEPRMWREDEVSLVREVADQTWDAIERVRAIAALAEREARFRFLTELDDEIRPLTDAHELVRTAARRLCRQLNADHVTYCTIEGRQSTLHVIGDYASRPEAPSLVGKYALASFGPGFAESLKANGPFVAENVETDPRTVRAYAVYRKMGICAIAAVPLHKAGRLVGAMGVIQYTPRERPQHEIELIQLVANRCWEAIDRTRIASELQEREQRYRFLAESIPQMVWTATPDGSVDYQNGRTRAYLGATSEHLAGEGWLASVHPEDRQRTTERWRESIATGQPYEIQFRLRRVTDGAWRWHLVRAVPMKGENGSIVQWFGSATDIQDQKVTEVELTRMNRELEEFAYVSSHDLQEPLRMVNTSAQLLLRRLGSNQDSEIQQFAANIRRGVLRMEALIRDLLTYSRVGYMDASVAAARADLNCALGEAISRLGSRLQENQAEVVADRLPEIQGDEGQLSHVFQNLLSNAVKYRKPDEPPRIELSAERQNSSWLLRVSDNGIGFDQAHAERIFGLFKRLHRQDEYPGTGLGLAICKRIVERHGGKIWAESQTGMGSTFFISLPGGVNE